MSDGEPRTPLLTGGCQCGAVRFAIYAEPVRIGICHCRMCQKAVGGPFIVLADVRIADFAWTRNAPASFQSSNIAARDFCSACGTPLSYRQLGGDHIELTAGAFDTPAAVVPTYEVGTESKLPWISSLASLPGRTTAEASGPRAAAIVTRQHPDGETSGEGA